MDLQYFYYCISTILFQDIIHFWLEKGVDGFRMDAVKHILEAEHLRDEPQVDPNKPPVSVNSFNTMNIVSRLIQFSSH